METISRLALLMNRLKKHLRFLHRGINLARNKVGNDKYRDDGQERGIVEQEPFSPLRHVEVLSAQKVYS